MSDICTFSRFLSKGKNWRPQGSASFENELTGVASLQIALQTYPINLRFWTHCREEYRLLQAVRIGQD